MDRASMRQSGGKHGVALLDELVEKGMFRTVTLVTVNALARANCPTR
jgi:hypothetical protein